MNSPLLTEPGAQVLHEIFEAQADARPQAPAVIYGREEATYADLEGRANRIARHLRRCNVKRGSIVAMLLRRSIDAYAALLGILKAGAAYVPIDPEYPPERTAYILENSGAATLVTTESLVERAASFAGGVVRLDTDAGAIAAESAARLKRDETGAGAGDLCYLIYTSGSTGRPKGVMIEHRNASHLVRAEGHIYGVRAEDRVYQGSSLSFDLAVEEVWLAFQAGATLVAATPEMAHAGPDLPRLLTENKVTVLSTVPTLLSMLVDDIPTVRLLILGGESCPDRLVSRWARPGRRILNTYGPTETTVIATFAELEAGKPVTIGRAVPGYRVHLLNDELRRVPPGEAGEICIGGMGVARGYVGLADETRARFVPDPFAPEGEPHSRMYRTGDLGRLDADGNIEFLGRVDGQMKLRGFRVELAEIESVLMQGDGVLTAACAVREDLPGIQQLVGYVVPSNGVPPNEERLHLYLRSRLPTYMVPGLIETVAELPRLPNGKLDRASLPKPRLRDAAPETMGRSPQTDTERRIAQVWQALFHPQHVSIDHDFFLDLGGHSLLAARMVSELRTQPRFARVSMLDLYEHPTIASLASALDTVDRPSKHAGESAEAPVASSTERVRHAVCGALQAVGLYFGFAFGALQWVTPYLVFFLLLANEHSTIESAGWALASAMAVFPTLIIVAVAVKWIVLGRIQAGRHPLWGGYYLRWWFAQSLVSALHLDYLSGTPLLPFIYRLLGAHIGRDVHIGTDRVAAFDLISIGDGTSIEEESSILGYVVENGELVIGPVSVGRRCFVGTRAVLSGGTRMEDGARLEDLSLLERGQRVPAGETWAGSPARPARRPHAAIVPPPAPGPLRRAAITLLYAVLLLVFPIVRLSPLVPGMLLLMNLDPVADPLLYLATLPLVGGSFVLLLTAEVVLLKWLLVGRVRAGRYQVHGSFYVRHWIVEQLMALSIDLVGPLRATLYLAPWYRALGAKLGRFVELSTATSTTPDLLDLGDGSTVADEASLGSANIEGGWMTVAQTRLGRRTFIGNSGVVPAGVNLADGSLVGVLSLAPTDRAEGARAGATWLGSPPRLLPRRQPSAVFPEERTFCPPRKLQLLRGAVEIFRVTLPPAGFILVTTAVIHAALAFWEHIGLGATLGLLPLVYAICCAAVMAAVALAKWTLIGRYRPFERPLWSNFVWRLEFVNSLYEFLATPLALDLLQGTPFLPWYWRLLGARIGRRVYVHTTGILEFDLPQVGDRVALNEGCILQTHLFEDRILKASRLQIDADCSVGADSVVLYDSKMEAGARLDALSLLMKGETLPAGTSWAGIPATWQDDPASAPAAKERIRFALQNKDPEQSVRAAA